MKALKNLIIMFLCIFAFSSCANEMYVYDDMYTSGYNTTTIITFGTPVYIDGYVSYYFYKGYYWYPYYRGNYMYFYRRHKPISGYYNKYGRYYNYYNYNNRRNDGGRIMSSRSTTTNSTVSTRTRTYNNQSSSSTRTQTVQSPSSSSSTRSTTGARRR